MSEQQPLKPTPIKSNIQQTPAATSGAHSMDDINMLMYLEALQRSADNEKVLAQRVEEAYKSYKKRYCDYVDLYSKYVALVKKGNTRKLIMQSHLIELNMTKAVEDVKCINDKLSDDIVTAYVSTPELEKLKKELCKHKKFDNLEDLRGEMMQLQKCTEAIQSSMEAIEAGLETGISLGLDISAEELHMTNFPTLNKKNETNSN